MRLLSSVVDSAVMRSFEEREELGFKGFIAIGTAE
jgi:hypothetical protein